MARIGARGKRDKDAPIPEIDEIVIRGSTKVWVERLGGERFAVMYSLTPGVDHTHKVEYKLWKARVLMTHLADFLRVAYRG